MNNMRITFVIAGLVALMGILIFAGIEHRSEEAASDEFVIPGYTGYVNDASGILNPTIVSELEELLVTFAESGNGEIAVLTLPTIEPYTIEEFGIRLADEWKVGDEELDNGIILIVVTEDREVRIEVGHGSEAYVTDARAGQILDEVTVPQLKTGDWDAAVAKTVVVLINELNETN